MTAGSMESVQVSVTVDSGVSKSGPSVVQPEVNKIAQKIDPVQASLYLTGVHDFFQDSTSVVLEIAEAGNLLNSMLTGEYSVVFDISSHQLLLLLSIEAKNTKRLLNLVHLIDALIHDQFLTSS